MLKNNQLKSSSVSKILSKLAKKYLELDKKRPADLFGKRREPSTYMGIFAVV